MKPKPILAFLVNLLTFSFLFTSCFPGSLIPDPYIVAENRQKENQYYVKAAPNVPLLTEKNDISIGGVISSGNRITGVELQAAYMAGKHIGILGSYSHIENGTYMKFNRYELGSGFVTQLSKEWHFETYTGFGNGKIKNTHYTGSSNLDLAYIFIQPAIAVSNAKKTVQFAFVSRFERVNFKVNDTLFDTAREPMNTNQVKKLYDQRFHIMWQPGILFRFGWQKFIFQSGYSYSADLSNSKIYGSKGNFSLGILFRFNTGEKNSLKEQ